MLDPIPYEIDRHTNQPEATTRTIDSLDVHELSAVATRLADLLADGEILHWPGGKFLCAPHIEADLAEDVRIMYDLVNLTLEAHRMDAQNYLIDKFNIQARDRIIEMLEDMGEMPRGYDLEDYL